MINVAALSAIIESFRFYDEDDEYEIWLLAKILEKFMTDD